MKHRWAAATPEERAAFLEATAKVAQKIKEAWENATPEQRKLLALEHPYFARKAFHHAWSQATPQEKVAFLVAHPALYGELKSRWSSATAVQKQWYVKNYPGVESLAAAKAWAETSTEERAAFLEANPAIADKARETWQKMQPEMRATAVRKWQGWPLKAYQARLDSGGKTMVSVKTRAAGTNAKRTDKAAPKH
jgi:2-oxo-4-hydroxy-4-carboxy--5-ureidoimidazoline (OHCU) decarboxylase